MKSGHSVRNSMHRAGIFLSDRKLVLGILFSAFALRLLLSAFVTGPVDSVTLAPLGREAAARGASLARSPLGSFFFRTVTALSGNSSHTLLFVAQCVISAVAILLIYYITRRIQSFGAAVIAAVIAAVFPNFIIYCFAMDTKNLCVMFAALIAAVLVSGLEDKRKAALAGIASGLAVLLEPVFLLFIPGIVILSRKRLLYLAAAAALLLPWTAWNSVHAGRPVPVFDVQTYKSNFSIAKFTGAEDVWEIGGAVYANISSLMMKSWEDSDRPRDVDEGKPHTRERTIRKRTRRRDQPESTAAVRGARRNIGYTAAYSYLLVMIIGIIGFLKYYKREHRPLVIQFSTFLLLLILFAVVNSVHRAIMEVAIIIYAAVFISASTGHITAPAPLSRSA